MIPTLNERKQQFIDCYNALVAATGVYLEPLGVANGQSMCHTSTLTVGIAYAPNWQPPQVEPEPAVQPVSANGAHDETGRFDE